MALDEDEPLPGLSSSSDLRPVNMDDFLYAQKQVDQLSKFLKSKSVCNMEMKICRQLNRIFSYLCTD